MISSGHYDLNSVYSFKMSHSFLWIVFFFAEQSYGRLQHNQKSDVESDQYTSRYDVQKVDEGKQWKWLSLLC